MSDELKWIKHDGGPMPVPGDTVVAIKMNCEVDGSEKYIHEEGKADIWGWDNNGESWQTAEYAIVKPSPSAGDTTNPPHYKTGDVECIDAIRAQLTPEQYKGYLKASLVKYMWRYEHKGAPEADLLKAQWFLERLIAEVRNA